MLIISYMVTWFPFLYNLNELMSLVGLASVPREIFCIFFNQAYPFFMICFHYEAHTSKKKMNLTSVAHLYVFSHSLVSYSNSQIPQVLMTTL